MKTSSQQKNKKTVRDQLFIVNQSAGRLRLLLIVLLFFIYWTLIAQTKIAALAMPDNFLKSLPEPINFTSGIIRDILLRYFSPSTILFSILPPIIFLSMKKMITHYLNELFPSIRLDEIDAYLNKCAFSFSKPYFRIGKTIFIQPQKTRECLKLLGGPAHLKFEPSLEFIIHNTGNQDYFLISSEYPENTELFFLPHGNTIYTIISKTNRQVLLKNLKNQNISGQTIDYKLTSLFIDQNVPPIKPPTSLSRKISMDDARFLSYLGNTGTNIIYYFLLEETKIFLHKNTSIIFGSKPLSSFNNQADEKILDSSVIRRHENYAENAMEITEKPSGVNRKHTHSRYTFLKKKKTSSLNIQDEEAKNRQLELQLSNHLNNKLKSFFHTSTIQLFIKEIEKTTIHA